MLNKERVKQLYKVAMYEKKEEKLQKQIGKYYRSDYIGKEILKSIFTGTIAYFFLSVLYAINRWEIFLREINQLDMKKMLIPWALFYVVFIVGYLFVTYWIYKKRYESTCEHLEKFESELQTLQKMYEREEKIK